MSCKFRLLYHIILVVKYRKKLLLTYGDFIKGIIINLTYKYKFSIECMEVDKDHIHILISSSPTYSPKFIVSIIKQYTTYRLYKEFSSDLRLYFFRSNVFWSKGYFINSIGNASEDTIRNYINNQG